MKGITIAIAEALAFTAVAIPNALIKEHAALQQRQSSSPTPFDPANQYVSTTGSHAFQAPGPNDSRGPCPALNAMANQGYIPRNGNVTIEQVIQGTAEGKCRVALGIVARTDGSVFNLGPQLAMFMAKFAASVVGDGATFLIGGSGLSSSHNRLESDVSPTRNDAYLNNGDASSLNTHALHPALHYRSDQRQLFVARIQPVPRSATQRFD